ncbi:hypothetical protein AC249_AIPGENE8474 [Exaiptasia diaphana]|nr:hypothetical protein AC249_AIPGENE8474 [Exaiptasia diaphana]
MAKGNQAHNPDLFKSYYLKQAQHGGNLPAFHGARFQRGYGIGTFLKGLFRSAVPFIKDGAKATGKTALSTGLNIASDVMSGRDMKSSARTRALQAKNSLKSKAMNTARGILEQKGKGIKRRASAAQASQSQTKRRKASAPQAKRRKSKQTGLESGRFVDYHSISNVGDNGPIEFLVSGAGTEYMDLSRTQLYVKAKVTKPDGSNLDPDTKVGVSNSFFDSLFVQDREGNVDKVDPTKGDNDANIDQLSNIVNTYPSAYIANVDKHDKNGSHWVAFYFSDEGRAEFWDSYGQLPSLYSKNFVNFLEQNSRHHIMNRSV